MGDTDSDTPDTDTDTVSDITDTDRTRVRILWIDVPSFGIASDAKFIQRRTFFLFFVRPGKFQCPRNQTMRNSIVYILFAKFDSESRKWRIKINFSKKKKKKKKKIFQKKKKKKKKKS